MIIPWNLKGVAKALHLTPEEYWGNQNGSTLSKTSEITVRDMVGGVLTESQEEYDVVAEPRKWAKIEVRNCFKKACFAPSTSTGKGRFFELSLFRKKTEECDSYVFVDLNPLASLKQPRAYEISAKLVAELYDMGALGKDAHIDFKERKRYPKDWKNKRMRFTELFPYEEFKFVPGRQNFSGPTARKVYNAAVKRINKKIGV